MLDNPVRAPTGAAMLLAVALAACGRASIPPLPAMGTLAPGSYLGRLEFDGRERSFLVHVPPAIADGRPLPVVVNYHGGGGNGQGHMAYTAMDSLADEGGFLLVVPDGTGRISDRLLTWNAGGCCGYAQENGVDDVGFTLALLEDLEGRLALDRRRIYATGLSNGAMMAYRLAAEASGTVAAIAPVGGAMLLQTFDPSLPVPILHIHSVDDPRALYSGGLGPPFPLTTHQIEHAAVEDVLARWAEHNGCGAAAEVVEQRESRPDPEAPPHSATLLSFADCPVGGDVRLWRLTGAGHVWPGGQRDVLESILGPATDVIDANREMWEFFEGFERGD